MKYCALLTVHSEPHVLTTFSKNLNYYLFSQNDDGIPH